MASDTEITKGVTVGLISSILGSNANAIAEIGKQRQRYYSWGKAAADGMASTTTAETDCNQLVRYAGRLKTLYIVCTGAALTADAANFATITVSKRDSAGANLTTLATLTTTIASSGNLAQRAPVAFVLTDANVDIAALSTLTFSIAKTGTGVVVPVSFFVAVVEDT